MQRLGKLFLCSLFLQICEQFCKELNTCAKHWFIAPHLQIHFLPILWKWMYPSIHFFSSWHDIQLCQKGTGKTLQGKRILLLVPVCSLGCSRRGFSRTHFCNKDGFSSNISCTTGSFSKSRLGSFVGTCFCWDISPWTAFQGSPEGGYPANSTSATHSYLPWPCPFPTRSKPQ